MFLGHIVVKVFNIPNVAQKLNHMMEGEINDGKFNVFLKPIFFLMQIDRTFRLIIE
jgi:hypothetical protein